MSSRLKRCLLLHKQRQRSGHRFRSAEGQRQTWAVLLLVDEEDAEKGFFLRLPLDRRGFFFELYQSLVGD